MTRALCQVENCKPRQTIPGTQICQHHEDKAWDACQAIAKTWPQTQHQLTHPPTHGDKIRFTPQPGLSLNQWILNARTETQRTLWYWTAQLIHYAPTLRVKGDTNDPPTLARFLGTNITHLTRRDFGPAFTTQITHTARLCAKAAHPYTNRNYRPGIPCNENDCAGQYTAQLWDGMGYLPDLQCTHDPSHVLTPAQFRRLGKKLTPDQAARRFLETIAGVEP